SVPPLDLPSFPTRRSSDLWYAHDGETADDNLISYCAFDHGLKDLKGWDYLLDPDTGCLTITTPTGDNYTSEPEPLHPPRTNALRSEEHTSELQSRFDLVCR